VGQFDFGQRRPVPIQSFLLPSKLPPFSRTFNKRHLGIEGPRRGSPYGVRECQAAPALVLIGQSITREDLFVAALVRHRSCAGTLRWTLVHKW
jgi:hypothetical protein